MNYPTHPPDNHECKPTHPTQYILDLVRRGKTLLSIVVTPELPEERLTQVLTSALGQPAKCVKVRATASGGVCVSWCARQSGLRVVVCSCMCVRTCARGHVCVCLHCMCTSAPSMWNVTPPPYPTQPCSVRSSAPPATR